MNFQPSDYLVDLNIDFDSVSPGTETSNNDLDLFTQTDFFDLDVFAKDSVPPNKQSSQVQSKVLSDESETKDEALYGRRESSSRGLISKKDKSVEELSSEDKRRRNTAASARFRIKKKMKEQQMEQKAKELQERVNQLEKKVKTLEMENKCLKNLILQKNDRKNDDLLETIKKRSAAGSSNIFEYTS